MELRQLRYFVAAAETGNISRAAQKIFLTQPALSRQIKALEEEIGQCLLERRVHSIRLTPAEAARESLLVFCQRDYPEYWNILTTWLREHRQRPLIAGEYDGVNSLLSAVESGMGVAVLTRQSAHLLPKRVKLKELSAAPKPLLIAAGQRSDRTDEKTFSVFIQELRLAAHDEK